MKKVGVFGIVVILMLSFVYAQEVLPTTAGQGTSLAQDTENAGKQAQQGLQGVSSSFNDQSNKALEQSVSVPDGLGFIASLFGVKGNLDLRHAIVLMCLWVLLFLILRQVLVVVPFFGEGWKSWVGGLIITMLAALSGGLKESADFFFTLGGFFGVLRTQSIFQLFLSVFVLLLLYTLFSKILKKMIREMHKAKAEAAGETLAEGMQSAKILSGGVKKLAKIGK